MRQFAGFASVGLLSLLLSGCGSNGFTTSTTGGGGGGTTTPNVVLTGTVHGGVGPISGAHVYVFAVGTSAYGGASTSLLSATATGLSDSTGAYVLSSSVGGFSITDAELSCGTATQVYVLATGGNAGVGTNSATGLMAAYGACPTTATTTVTWVNEVSTVAAAYALAGFATDATHISSSGSALALTGMKNAFALAGNLYSITTGQALATTVAGNGTAPQTTVNGLANILGACVNTASATSPGCNSLFSDATNAKTPSDTATAAIYIAQNPAVNAAALYTLLSGSALTFQPSLASAPTSWVLPVVYTGGGMAVPLGIAVDSQGNVWLGNQSNGIVSEFTPVGKPVSASGFANGSTGTAFTLEIDSSGNVWTLNNSTNTVSEISSSGVIQGAGPGFTSANLVSPLGLAFDRNGMLWIGDNNGLTELTPSGTVVTKIAVGPGAAAMGDGVGDVEIDGLGNVWATDFDDNVLLKFTGTGVPLLGTGVPGGGMSGPQGIAFDAQNNVWVANANGTGASLSKFSNAGVPLSTNGFSGGGLSQARFVAIDGAGNAWVASSRAGVISEFNSSGVPYASGGFVAKANGTGFREVAIDGSGNVWATSSDNTLVELVGAAAPVVTPLVTAASTNRLGTRP